jgi:hypothetical protein
VGERNLMAKGSICRQRGLKDEAYLTILQNCGTADAQKMVESFRHVTLFSI